MKCSDTHLAYVCSRCGGLLSVATHSDESDAAAQVVSGSRGRRVWRLRCSVCCTGEHVRPIYLPYVYR